MLLLLKIKQTPQLSYGGLYLRLCCSNDFKTDSVGLNRKIYCTFTSPDISQSAWWLVGFDPNWIQLASIKHLLGSITNKKVPFLKLSYLNSKFLIQSRSLYLERLELPPPKKRSFAKSRHSTLSIAKDDLLNPHGQPDHCWLRKRSPHIRLLRISPWHMASLIILIIRHPEDISF